MEDQFKKFSLQTSKVTGDATSSAGFWDGTSHSSSPDGPSTERSGPEAALVSHSVLPASASEQPTPDTCGPSGSGSSRSASLQRSLESRLRQRLGSNGSTHYLLTWKVLDMPSREPICQLTRKDTPTKDGGYTSLPTPQCVDAKGYSNALRNKFRKTGHLKHWVHGTALAIHSRTGVSSWPKPELTSWMMGFPPCWLYARPLKPSATR